MCVKLVVSHYSARPGLYAALLLCAAHLVVTTFFWASNLGLSPLQSEVLLLALLSMGNICTWPRMLFDIALKMQNNAYVSVILAKFPKFQ